MWPAFVQVYHHILPHSQKQIPSLHIFNDCMLWRPVIIQKITVIQTNTRWSETKSHCQLNRCSYPIFLLKRAFQNSQLCQASSWHFSRILQECHQVVEAFVFKMERLGSGTSYGCRHGPVHRIFWTINLHVIISSHLDKLQKLLRINWIKCNTNTAKYCDREGEIKCTNGWLRIIG